MRRTFEHFYLNSHGLILNCLPLKLDDVLQLLGSGEHLLLDLGLLLATL